MSIQQELSNASQNGRLYELPPLVGLPRRELYVHQDIEDVVWPEWADDQEGKQHGAMRASLDRFSLGLQSISVAQKPFRKKQNTFLARVDPTKNECWSIRCLQPGAGIRVLGRFLAKDCFVALYWNYREVLDVDDEWEKAVATTTDRWRAIFSYPPFSRGQINDYLSQPFENSEA